MENQILSKFPIIMAYCHMANYKMKNTNMISKKG